MPSAPMPTTVIFPIVIAASSARSPSARNELQRSAGGYPTAPRLPTCPAQCRRGRLGDLRRRAGHRRRVHALGHPADHEAGRTISSWMPVPCSASASPQASRPGPPWPIRRRSWARRGPARRRREHHQPSPTGGAHALRERQQVHLGHVVGVHDGHRVRGIVLARAWSPERRRRTAAPMPSCSASIVLNNAACEARSSASNSQVWTARRRAHRLHLVGQLVGPARGEHHRVARRQPDGQFQADLAAAKTTPDHPAAAIRRVVHGCDYHLRYF